MSAWLLFAAVGGVSAQPIDNKKDSELIARQKFIKNQFAQFKTKMLELADLLEKTDPDSAAILRQTVDQMFENVLAAIEHNDVAAATGALRHETQLNQMQLDLRRTHVRRLSEATCSPIAGLIFVDVVDNVEKIGDHLTNVAQAIIGGLQWNGKNTVRPDPVVETPPGD